MSAKYILFCILIAPFLCIPPLLADETVEEAQKKTIEQGKETIELYELTNDVLLKQARQIYDQAHESLHSQLRGMIKNRSTVYPCPSGGYLIQNTGGSRDRHAPEKIRRSFGSTGNGKIHF